jgi:hypothetical protein
MLCPNCSNPLSTKPKTLNEDGGLIIIFPCNHCNKEFETFVSEFDLSEHFNI